MACCSAGAVWAGFAFRRADIRSTGLWLTIVHTVATALAASGGSAAGIALSLLGAGAVCFAISYGYNRAAAIYGLDEEPATKAESWRDFVGDLYDEEDDDDE